MARGVFVEPLADEGAGRSHSVRGLEWKEAAYDTLSCVRLHGAREGDNSTLEEARRPKLTNGVSWHRGWLQGASSL